MKRPSLSMKRALGGAARALGGGLSKGSRFQLTGKLPPASSAFACIRYASVRRSDLPFCPPAGYSHSLLVCHLHKHATPHSLTPSVQVDAVRLNPQTATAAAGGDEATTTSVVVELERGTRRVESSAVSVSELARSTGIASNTNWGPPLQQVVTLFRVDSKGGGTERFRPKPFILRVRLAKVM